MGAVQLSLVENTLARMDQWPEVALPRRFTKREYQAAQRMIERLLKNSEKNLKAALTSLWHQKYHHYTCERMLIRNLAKRLMVDEAVVARWRSELGLPSIEAGSLVFRPMSLCGDYLTEDDELNDPLQNFINAVYLTPKQQNIWERYCRVHGTLLPEEVRHSDIRYVLQEAPISYRTFYAIFHQEPHAFCQYLHDSGFNVRALNRFGVQVPLATLITKNERIRKIVVRYTQELYTNRGVPIPVLAERLDLDQVELWRLGERYGDWGLPSHATLNAIIAQSVISHISC